VILKNQIFSKIDFTIIRVSSHIVVHTTFV